MLDWWPVHKQPPEGIEATPSARSADPTDALPLVLMSMGGETIPTSCGTVKQCGTLSDMLIAQGAAPDLSQPLAVQLDAEVLRAVIEWCDFRKGDPPFKLVLRPVRRRYDHFSLSAEERRCLEDHRLALWDLAAAADYLHVPRLYYAACMALHVLAESHCRKTRRLIKSMRYKTLGKTITAKCHVVPRDVPDTIYFDVLRFDSASHYNDCTLPDFREYGGYLMKLAELHSAVLPPVLRRARVHLDYDDVSYENFYKAHPYSGEHHPDFPKPKLRVCVQRQDDLSWASIGDEIGQLSRFALTELHVFCIRSDIVMAYLRQRLPETAVVACETLLIGLLSADENQFLQEIALVQRLVETLRHVQGLNIRLTRHQLFAFLPRAVDFKLPPHVALHITCEVKNVDDAEDNDDYGTQKWLQLMRTLEQMHENPIRILPHPVSLLPAMLRTLYEEYANAEDPTDVKLRYGTGNSPHIHSDVESVVVELGLRLVYKEPEDVDVGTYPKSFRRFWQSTARKGFTFSVVASYYFLSLRIVKGHA